ncbi:MAG: hypothetical protein RLZZ301_97 [Bacteroidota bacterium]|jgi:hypothetical protein
MKHVLFFTFLSVLLMGCGKISTPNETSKKLFGKWRYVSSSGGFSGTGVSGYDASDTYEYTENGTFSHRKGGQLIDQMSFSINTGTSIISMSQVNMVNYSAGLTQSILITNDTLVLSDEVYDGFQYVLIRI